MFPRPQVQITVRFGFHLAHPFIHPGTQHVYPAASTHQQVKQIPLAQRPHRLLKSPRAPLLLLERIPIPDHLLHPQSPYRTHHPLRNPGKTALTHHHMTPAPAAPPPSSSSSADHHLTTSVTTTATE